MTINRLRKIINEEIVKVLNEASAIHPLAKLVSSFNWAFDFSNDRKIFKQGLEKKKKIASLIERFLTADSNLRRDIVVLMKQAQFKTIHKGARPAFNVDKFVNSIADQVSAKMKSKKVIKKLDFRTELGPKFAGREFGLSPKDSLVIAMKLDKFHKQIVTLVVAAGKKARNSAIVMGGKALIDTSFKRKHIKGTVPLSIGLSVEVRNIISDDKMFSAIKGTISAILKKNGARLITYSVIPPNTVGKFTSGTNTRLEIQYDMDYK